MQKESQRSITYSAHNFQCFEVWRHSPANHMITLHQIC